MLLGRAMTASYQWSAGENGYELLDTLHDCPWLAPYCPYYSELLALLGPDCPHRFANVGPGSPASQISVPGALKPRPLGRAGTAQDFWRENRPGRCITHAGP